MQELPIRRELTEEQRIGETIVGNVFCSIYDNGDEVIVTDGDDPTRIYQITAKEFWNVIEEGE